MLEIGLICERFNCAPDTLGLDTHDPRVTRSIRTALNVYDTAMSRKRAKDASKWDKANPHGVSLLHWARNGESDAPDPREAKFQMLPRPRGR